MDISFGDSGSTSTTSYLPGYLLGGNSQSSVPMSRNWPSPPSQRSPFGSRGPISSPRSSASTATTPQRHFSVKEKLQHSSLRGTTPTISRTPKDSIGAPPVEGLYDSRYAVSSPMTDRKQMDSTSVFSPGNRSTYHTPVQAAPDTTFGSVFSSHNDMSSPPSPAQVDPFYTQGESLSSGDVLNDCWITVFGFPPAATSYILQQFSQYGNIMRHEAITNSNWMHIQYQSKLQAKKALSKHGKVFGGNLMIAVIPCIEKNVMDGTGKENNIPIKDQTMSDVSMKTMNVTPSRVPIRPLTAAYQAASSQHQVIPHNDKTPQKSDTVLSKAMEYMFGW